MDVKCKNNERRVWLAVLLIGIGLLVFVGSPVISTVTTSSRSVSVEQAVSELAGSIGSAGSAVGETVGDIGSSIGETAGQVGETIGETAGGFGRDIGNLFADRGPTVGERVFSWLPLLLVAAGLILIFRRPGRKEKNDDPFGEE